nr:hypothetical protein [uncultured Chryseobacterium sp.]
MKKKKLQLDELKIQSFGTSKLKKVKGGFRTSPTDPSRDPSYTTYCPPTGDCEGWTVFCSPTFSSVECASDVSWSTCTPGQNGC